LGGGRVARPGRHEEESLLMPKVAKKKAVKKVAKKKVKKATKKKAKK
jgi:hypothetical protein